MGLFHLHTCIRSSFALFLILQTAQVDAQNLVPNPGFESYLRLPCGLNEFLIQDLLEHWVQPIPTTTDYWNSLTEESCFLNPANIEVNPRTGTGMVGIITAVIREGVRTEYKEYLEVKLTEPLKKNRLYKGEFYAKSLRNQSIPRNILETNNLGIAFSDSLIKYPLASSSPDHLVLNAQIIEKSIIQDQWQSISGCFLSKKNYTHMLIGNFEISSQTNIIQLTNTESSTNAYYLIDDVALYELNYDLSSLLNTIVVCSEDEPVTLNASVQGATDYTWEDGGTDAYFPIIENVTKDYSVLISFDECTYKHTFQVKYIPDTNLGRDTVMCYGEVLELNPAHPIKDYVWEDGSTDTVRYILEPGTYTVVVGNDNCIIQDSISVDFIDCPGFVPNIITPNGDEFNQFLVFENIENRVWSLQVYNRWGSRVYTSSPYLNDWDASGLSEGNYYFILHSEQLKKSVKGWVQVLYK